MMSGANLPLCYSWCLILGIVTGRLFLHRADRLCFSGGSTISFGQIKEPRWGLEELGVFLQQTTGELSRKANLSTAA